MILDNVLFYIADRISAEQDIEWVKDRELEKATDTLGEELCTFLPLGQRTATTLPNEGEDAGLAISIELESHTYCRLRYSDDQR